jgi:hypothetical protein
VPATYAAAVYFHSVIVGRLLIGKTGRFIQLFLRNRQSRRVSAIKTLPKGTVSTLTDAGS